MNSLCQTCRKMLYRTDPCKGDGVECGRTDGGSKKSTAPRKVVGVLDAVGYAVDGPNSRSGSSGSFPPPSRPSEPDTPKAAGTQAPPVDTTKPKHKDRHKPGYQAEKQRQYRANKKAKEAAK